MNIIKKSFARILQKTFYITNKLVKIRVPKIIKGENSVKEIPTHLKELKIDNVLVVTGKTILSLGMPNNLFEYLNKSNIKYSVYTTQPDPTVQNIEEGLEIYKKNNCQAIIGFGGGSPIDTAKVIGARVARPNKSVAQLKGILKVIKKTPIIFAVPTTAGTGSEATIAAVVSNPEKQEKYPLMDPVLVPSYAVLDPTLTVGLSPKLTATTGMDALTHAIEAFIGNSNSALTEKNAIDAVKLIFENMTVAYHDGKNLVARENMQNASYFAGIAFTRAYVGHVHSISHTLGGYYHIPHGLANAVVLPYILEEYGEKASKKLAILARKVNICNTNDMEATKEFIEKIKEMNKEMNLPIGFSEIKKEDIAEMADKAYKESYPLYPTPKLFDKSDFIKIYDKLSL